MHLDKRINGHFAISHLPSGMGFSFHTFSDQEKAAEAMIEISRLRNRWVDIPVSEENKLMGDIEAICTKHGGSLLPAKIGRPEASSLNGYEEPTVDETENK